MDIKLTDIHEVLTEAKTEKFQDGKMETYTYKAMAQTKQDAESICKTNGTTLSAFVRGCLKALVKDYNPSSK
jgi:hypothetical protein